VRGRAVEIEIVFFDVLSVVGFAIGQAKKSFLQDGILPVPQRQRETKQLMIVAYARKTVLAPMIGTRSRMVMCEIFPGVAILAIVLADGAPLAFAEIGPPFSPGNAGGTCFV
jgi:hypothetical protein